MQTLKPLPLELLDKYRGDQPLPLYTGRVRVTGGEAAHGRASGVAVSDDRNLQVDLRAPPALGGDGQGTNPEQLLAAGYAACFHGALMLLAARMGLVVNSAHVEVAVTFSRDPVDGLFQLSAEVRVALPGMDKTSAAELVRKTERICPYAKMFRNGIDHVVVAVTETT